MKQKTSLSFLAVVLSLGVFSTAQAENREGQVLGLSCTACHGTNGHSPGSIPTIAGKTPDFIANAMRDFRDGKRPATVMNRLAKGYTDAQIDALAAYYAQQ